MRLFMVMVVAIGAATTNHAQVPLSVDTTFRSPILSGSIYVGDLFHFADGRVIASGLMELAPDPWNPKSLVLMDAHGEVISTVGGSSGSGRIIANGDKFFIGGGQFYRKWNADLTLDWNYHNINPFISPQHGGRFHVYPDGKVITTGSMDLRSFTDTSILGYGYCLVRFDTNGYWDTTFTPRKCVSGFVSNVSELPDGRLQLSGRQDLFDGHEVGCILRVWPDGSLDTTFRTNCTGWARDYWYYPDGRFLAAGAFYDVPEYPGDTLHLMRFFPNGDIDTSFPNTLDFRNPEFYFESAGSLGGIFELLPNVLVLTGTFSHVEGLEAGGIVAIDTNGTLLHDQYFTGTGCDTVDTAPGVCSRYPNNRMDQAPDGSYYIYGAYSGFDDGHTFYPDQPYITRLHGFNVAITERPPVSSAVLDVFPNPGGEQITVTWSAHEKYDLLITDVVGRLALRVGEISTGQPIDVSGLSVGPYMITAWYWNGTRVTSKWIKQ
jgi:hypothetical protein